MEHRGCFGEILGVESRNRYNLFCGWSSGLRRSSWQGVITEDKRERGPSAQHGPDPAASAPAHRQPSPLLGWKDLSQIKIAGKEQPRIVLCKSREIRRVSCGLETASHTAVIRTPMKTHFRRLAILLAPSKKFCCSRPRANSSYFGTDAGLGGQ